MSNEEIYSKEEQLLNAGVDYPQLNSYKKQ